MAIKDFELSVESDFSGHDDDDILEFRLKDKDGKWVVYETHYPDEGSVGLFFARTQGSLGKAFAAMEFFMEKNFLPDTYAEIIDRIGDRKDPLTLSSMIEVINYIIEEAAEGTPTTGSSPSTPSPAKTGTGSKASTRVRASSSSGSRRAGS